MASPDFQTSQLGIRKADMIFIKDNNKLKHLTRSALILSAILFSGLSFSCSNFIERIEDDIEEKTTATTTSSDMAHLSIKMSTKGSGTSRTVFPTLATVEDLSNFVLKGKLENEEIILAPAEGQPINTIGEFPSDIEILPGKWTFTLTAEYSGTTYAATVTNKTINRGAGNSVSFVLTPQGDFGGFVLNLDLSSNTSVDKVKATLTTLSGEEKDSKIWDSEALTEAGRQIEYFYSGNDEDPSAVDPEDPYNTQNIIRVGTYLVSFEFFTDNDPTPINQLESYIKVSPAT
jgi:hypothetical protein